MVEVALENVSKYFGETRAVDNLTMKVEDKEFLILLGPSGCGKTTTMRLVAGLETPTSGNIYIGDTLVNDLPPKDRDVAMVFQSYALYPHMSVFDNIAFPLKMHKVRRDEIRTRVKKTAELLRIDEYLDRKPKQLSGGEMQRVALGRAIVREPKVFLMDEPLSNLDAKLRVYMRAELKALQMNIGITTIYVTHDQLEAMTMGDRIAVMSKGLLQQLGPADQIYSRPTNLFVGGFMGSPPMNFVDCSLTDKNGRSFLDAGTFQLDVTDMAGTIRAEATGLELILGVRPEDVSVHTERPAGESIEGKVFVVEPLGSEVIINVRVGETLFKARGAAGFAAEMGSRAWITVDRKKMHVFDKKTEKAIV